MGYSSLHAFTSSMQCSEADARLHDALKSQRWATVARLYNGPDYERNLYDVKLERAYSRYRDREIK